MSRDLVSPRVELLQLLGDEIGSLRARMNAHDAVLATLFSLLNKKDEAFGKDFIVALHSMTASYRHEADLAAIARLSHLLVETQDKL